MLAHSTNCPNAVCKEELPISFKHFSKKHYLAGDKARIKCNRIHFTNSFVILIMRQRRFHDELTHVMIVVIVSEKQALVNTFLVIRGEVKRCADCDLQCSSKSSVHQVFDSLNSEIELLSGLPVITNHDGEVRM